MSALVKAPGEQAMTKDRRCIGKPNTVEKKAEVDPRTGPGTGKMEREICLAEKDLKKSKSQGQAL
jgi:hypothetical protein